MRSSRCWPIAPVSRRATSNATSRPDAIEDRFTAFRSASRIFTTPRASGRRRRSSRFEIACPRAAGSGGGTVGKTNRHQFGMGRTGLESCFGPVRNPWNDAYIPGGSSSGSAAAVAAGLCWATLDTDAIGSCRLPAACCGVVGFKGTYGLIDPAGILEGEKADEAIVWLSHPAITARSARDALLVVNVLAERHVEAPRRTPLRVGAANTSGGDRQIAGAFNAAIETLRTLGHQIVRARVPFDTPPMDNLKTIETDRATIAGRAFKDVDVIVLPTTTTPVPQVADAQGKPQALAAANTFFANYFGLPALSVLCGFDRHGLPLGVQIIGRPWDDGVVLGLADQFQTATDWHTRHPVA